MPHYPKPKKGDHTFIGQLLLDMIEPFKQTKNYAKFRFGLTPAGLTQMFKESGYTFDMEGKREGKKSWVEVELRKGNWIAERTASSFIEAHKVMLRVFLTKYELSILWI